MAFDKKQYTIDYIRENQRQFMVKVSRKTEPDMIEWLEKQGNIQAYIRNLIREDMDRNNASAPVPENK